ncbi:MAG: hypothetical protein A2203_09905 [Chromatiales bacterium RIFOXYA1_FULL_46_5]|nr:MAG: hypothetical protein A2203_09905 [Chromatiales bacterium RIFOXYA1_FULL_46_5]
MKKIILSAFMALLANKAIAGYVEGQDLNRVYVDSDGFAYFGTSSQPPNTCNFFGEYFRLDVKTDSGKAMLSILLSSKMAQKKIIIWYNESTSIGTNHSTGCSVITMSSVTAVGVNQ